MLTPVIKEITFDQILPVWSSDLWPGRESKIEPMSAIDINSNIDIDIFNFADSAHYYAAFENNEIIGVISGHLTTPNQSRLRGLYVHPNHRGKSIARLLIQTEVTHAKSLGCTQIWALIRTKNLGLFEKFGFTKHLETSKYEFSPHFIVQRNL